VALVVLALVDPAYARSSVWERSASERASARSELETEAELFELRYQHLLESPQSALPLDEQESKALGEAYLAQAASLLERAGAASSRDPFLVCRLADTYALLKKQRAAAKLFEEALLEVPPPVLQARIYARLALTYGETGRVDEEVAAYTDALETEALASTRARLFANRAEALMHKGDIAAAIVGYREALMIQDARSMSTTLFGLAVALDRTGDLEQALTAIRLARSYDPIDKELNGPRWTYLPEYDRYWYDALGHWSHARAADADADRDESYARTLRSWNDYIARAPRDDRWLGIARIRWCAAWSELQGSAPRQQRGGRRPPDHRCDQR
jgi:tetratricopeptide (TPR) repeat protein